MIDKTTWPDGPWKEEPDRREWQHEGFPCLMVRQERAGHWCGYVGVPPSHPLHGRSWDEGRFDHDLGMYHPAPTETLSIHGGITYARECQGDVCHVAAPGEPDDVWWLGFDCCHGGDLMPGYLNLHKLTGLESIQSFKGGTYRDVAYMTAETNSLAEQLRALQPIHVREQDKLLDNTVLH